MKQSIKAAFLLSLAFLFVSNLHAQIENTILNANAKAGEHKVPFFTNRPIVIEEDNTISFKNSSTKKTNTLYFCNYNFDTDSIEVNYRAINLSDKYPTEPIKHNLIYEIYEYARLKRGIKDFYIVVGGYGKSFNKQINSYMQRLKNKYCDELFGKASITIYAWGTEEDAYQYYNAVRKSKNGANDFAIFQHMLEEFISDTEYFKTHPDDFKLNIMFSSMGNNLFKEYMERRAQQGIPLKKVYNNIAFFGSVAPRNAFEKGKAFYNLDELADTVYVYVNSKDVLLKLSSIAHFKNRMGNKGPKNPDKLPGYIKIHDIKDIITGKDMTAGLGHDYLLTNSVLQEEILENIEERVKENSP